MTNNPRMLIGVNAARVIKAVTNTPLDIPEDAEMTVEQFEKVIETTHLPCE